MLRVQNLRKSFGGLKATADVSLHVAVGEIHGLIGPNGAGKSTLIGQIAGTLQPDSGSVQIDGADVTHRSAAARVARGLGRSFQITSLWPDLSVLENVLLGAQRALGLTYRMWSAATSKTDAVRASREALAYVGLDDERERAAGSLAYGLQKQLELAIVLAGQPRVLLLDEPLAGVGQVEAERLVTLIERLRGDRAVLLVEHDMDAMFRLADRISVLHLGAIIASGLPDEVRQDALVREAYLGDDL
jgi:branched-chain amino acid transport system ATP-binding protein